MKLRITSDGSPLGARVVDAATGEAVEDLLLVEVRMTPHGTYAVLHVHNPQVDVLAEDPNIDVRPAA